MTREERTELINEVILYIKSKESKVIKNNDFKTATIYQSLRNGIRDKFINNFVEQTDDEKPFDTLTIHTFVEGVCASAIDRDIEDVLDYIKDVLHVELSFVDEKISNGVEEEDCEDEYVMMRSYDFTYNKVNFHILLYYGDKTYVVTDYELHVWV